MIEFNPCFIDFEASSLSFDSYPIEIAWGSDINHVESYLISPETIQGWVDWSDESQKIHGIPRDELIIEGKEPQWICKKVYNSLDGKHVYSDAAPFDTDWLHKLFDAANLPLPQFIIKDIDELLIAEIACSNNDIDDIEKHIEYLKEKARRKVIIRHRAAYDVQYLIELWNLSKSP